MKLSGILSSISLLLFTSGSEGNLCDGSGRFTPKPFQYYEIGVQVGVWNIEFNRVTFSGAHETVAISAARQLDTAHWRFISDSSGKWGIINRSNAHRLSHGKVQTLDGLEILEIASYTASDDAATLHSIECNNDIPNTDATSAFVKIRFGASNFTVFIPDSPLVLDSPSNPNEFVWFIREVRSFVKGDIKIPELVFTPKKSPVVAVTTAISIASGLAAVATFGALGGGIAIVGAIVPLLLPQENEFQALANDVLAITGTMIQNSISQNDVAQFGSVINNVNTWFLNSGYPQQKELHILNKDAISLHNLGFSTQLSSNTLDVEIDRTMGFAFASDPQALVTDRLGFELYKKAMVDRLLMLQEATGLLVYANPGRAGYGCESVMANITGIAESVNKYITNLNATKNGLMAIRLQGLGGVTVRRKDGLLERYEVSVKDPFLGLTFYRRDGVKRDTKNEYVRAYTPFALRYKNEMENDMLHFSYPIDNEMRFFESFFNNTLTVCRAIDLNLADRRQFETNSKTLTPVDPVCYPDGSICSQSAHCCVGLTKSSDNKCRPIRRAI